MTEYDKRTVYLDMKENNIFLGNAGFAKIIVQNGQMRLTVNISGIPKTDSTPADIVFVKGEKHITIDTLYINEGRSVYSRFFTAKELQANDIKWSMIYKMYIKIAENRILEAVINPGMQMIKEESPQTEVVEDKEEFSVVSDDEMRKEEYTQNIEMEECAQNIEIENNSMCEPSHNQGKIFEDKWKQLESIFPHVHPFGDSRVFLSVKPKDFVILTKEYQHLSGNSFLLHGFYNYNHIILGKLQDSSDERMDNTNYYIGVPGVYYEREKAVAVMFGFDSFECNREPATTGTFGYYMKKVEI